MATQQQTCRSGLAQQQRPDGQSASHPESPRQGRDRGCASHQGEKGAKQGVREPPDGRARAGQMPAGRGGGREWGATDREGGRRHAVEEGASGVGRRGFVAQKRGGGRARVPRPSRRERSVEASSFRTRSLAAAAESHRVPRVAARPASREPWAANREPRPASQPASQSPLPSSVSLSALVMRRGGGRANLRNARAGDARFSSRDDDVRRPLCRQGAWRDGRDCRRGAGAGGRGTQARRRDAGIGQHGEGGGPLWQAAGRGGLGSVGGGRRGGGGQRRWRRTVGRKSCAGNTQVIGESGSRERTSADEDRGGP